MSDCFLDFKQGLALGFIIGATLGTMLIVIAASVVYQLRKRIRP